MKVEIWPLSRLIPYEKNARKIPPAAVDAVAKSLLTYGWQQPIVADRKDVIVVGHARRLGAMQLGWNEAPVVIFEGSPAQARQYRLMDNRSHEYATWDPDILRLELGELKQLDLDLSFTGFLTREIDKYLTLPAEAEDAVPDPQAVTIVQPGEMWTLGRHTLLCRDATDPASIAIASFDKRAALMVTDPPYGVSYDATWRLERGVNKPWQKRAEGKVMNDDRCDWTPAWKVFTGDIAYVWHPALHSDAFFQSLERAGFGIRAQLIWAKKTIVMGRGNYHWQHEPCWYAVRNGKNAQWVGDRKQSTLWQVDNMHRTQGNVDDGKTNHSTQKPVEVMRRPILNHTKPGAYVYDPFVGSGTTLIACELTERSCIALDIDPVYCDMTIRRWMNLTGKTAYNQDGVCFPNG